MAVWSDDTTPLVDDMALPDAMTVDFFEQNIIVLELMIKLAHVYGTSSEAQWIPCEDLTVSNQAGASIGARWQRTPH